MKNFSKIKEPLVCFFLLFLFLGSWLLVFSLLDPYRIRANRTSAYDFPDSEWQSDDPFIYLRVDDYLGMVGYMLLDGEEVEIECGIDWGQRIIIHRKPNHNCVEVSDYILEGTCVCKAKQIKIVVKKDYCFDGKYDVIILKRLDTEDKTK